MFLRNGPSQKDDLELIERFKSKNDQNALGELFTRYSSLVYGVCLKYLRDRDDAKDAVMQIFEKLNKSLMDHSIDYFKGWLYTTCRNHCLMQIRAQKNIKTEEIRDFSVENDFILHLDVEDEKEQDFEKLERCIQQLKEEQKSCVELFYLSELCYKDIVNKTGIELNKVKSHIQNGKRNIKICMEQGG